MAGRPKGTPKTGGGSRKGIPNKNTKALKDMILQALDDLGGVEYLVGLAKETPTAFATLLGKVLPTQVTQEPGDTFKVEQITRRIVDASEH